MTPAQTSKPGSDQALNPHDSDYQQRVVIYSRLLTMLGVFAVFTSSFYLIVYLRTGIIQNLWAAIPILVTVVLIPLINRLAKRGAIILPGILTLVGVSVAYGVNELLWSGLTPYHIVGGVLLILLTGNLVLQRKWWVWSSTIIVYLGYIFLAYTFHPLQRLKVSDLPVLLPYAIGTNILLVLALATLIIRSIRTRTIRTRLLVNFILLVLTPVILSAVITSILNAQNAQRHVQNQLESVATLKEAEINAWINSLHANLLSAKPAYDQQWVFISSREPSSSLSGNEEYSLAVKNITTGLKTLTTQTQVFEKFLLLNTQGKIFISTDESLLNNDQSSEPFFQAGLTGNYISPLQPSLMPGALNSARPETNVAVLILSVPVINASGETLGVLAGYADLAILNKTMYQRSGLGKTGETFLVSPDQILLTDSRFDGYTSGNGYFFDTTIQQALAAQENGKAIYRNYRGVNAISAYRWLPNLQILLVAEQEQSEALSSTYQTLGINLGVVIVAALVALLAGWYAARGITDPLLNLTKTAEAIASGDFSLRAEIEQDDEVGGLAKSFNSMTEQLQVLFQGLEQRVSARTREVERRSAQLQAAAEIARETTATRDLVELLRRAVDLVVEYFGFYHTGIFLVDERGEYAVLRAATGVAGEQMLRDGYKLAIIRPEFSASQRAREHQGVVSYVCWSGVHRIVSDVNSDPIYFKNPALPETRAEVALPLRVGSQVIGVLDAQSTDEGIFKEDTVRILQTMADLLAIAIENARLFQNMNDTVRELETVYGKYTRDSWAGLINHGFTPDGANISDYRYRGLTVETGGEPNTEVEEALHQSHTIVKTEENLQALAIPLRLRGQTVGVMNLRIEGEALPAETINTYEEIANRLVLVLENARLLQEAQQLAKREQQINLISTRIRSSSSTDAILRNTIRELGAALGASRTFIQLGIKMGDTGFTASRTDVPSGPADSSPQTTSSQPFRTPRTDKESLG